MVQILFWTAKLFAQEIEIHIHKKVSVNEPVYEIN